MAPRISMIPGRFVEDPRADIAHFKVLTALGRHTDEDGWCKIKQITIGSAVQLTRETVCRKLKDLVTWGYVQKHAADATGRAIYYRVLLDAPHFPGAPSDAHSRSALASGAADDSAAAGGQPKRQEERPVSGGSQVDGLYPTCDPPLTPGVIPSDHTRCDHTQSHITTLLNDPSERKSPQPPEGGGGEGGVFPGRNTGETSPAAEPVPATSEPQPGVSPGRNTPRRRTRRPDVAPEVGWLATLRDEGRHLAVLDGLIDPILRERAVDARLTPDPLAALRACLHRWREAPRPVLDAAVEIVIAARHARVKPADIDDAVRRAQAARRADAAPSPALPAVACEADASARFAAALARSAKPEMIAAWFSPCGVREVVPRGADVRVVIVTPHPVRLAEQFARSPAAAAARSLWGRTADVTFKQGLPAIETASEGAAP